MDSATKKLLQKQGYRFTGQNSAIKVCEWTKKCILGKGVCYKNTFYGINTHQCVQLAPALENCTHKCVFCWRYLEHTNEKQPEISDSPKEMVDNAIKQHVKLLQGLGGNKNKDPEKYKQAQKPLHFAISLAGEPTLYPKLPELIDEIRKRKMSSFLVTNGTNPAGLKKLLAKHEPTQLYITLPAPDEKTYKKICNPLIKDSWNKILESLSLLSKFKCRKTIRLTLVKDLNMTDPEGYAKLIKDINADFIEAKAYVFVGSSRERLIIENMPIHTKIREFSKSLGKMLGLKIDNEKKESRVVLLNKSGRKAKIDFSSV